MTIQVQINSELLEGFTLVEVGRGFLDASGTFSLQISLGASEGKVSQPDYPLKIGDKITIFVNGTTFLSGFIEKLNVRHSGMNLSINFSGRDRTADIIDSTISFTQSQGFSGGMFLQDICESLIDNLGITDVDVKVDTSNGAISDTDLFFDKGKVLVPSEGDSIIKYLNKCAEDKGLLLNTDGEGNLIITRGGTPGLQIATKLLLEIDGLSNNILESTASWDYTKRFNDYVFFSQPAMSSFDESDKPTNDEFFNGIMTPGTVTDDEIRKPRVLNLETNLSLDKKDTEARATWEKSLRGSRSLQYTCRVDGFTYDGSNIWIPNLLVFLNDDYALIPGTKMLVDHVKFTQSTNTETTELVLVDANSYLLQTKLTKQQDQAQQLGDGYKASFS